jgi:Predicted acetyltransferase, GNAT superfamily
MDNITNLNVKFDDDELKGQIVVRKAVSDDIDEIMDVACSVGNSSKVHSQGFLVDDYTLHYNHFRRKFSQLIMELEYFYVVESSVILGFLIAYGKDQWLSYNLGWMEDVVWHPQFDRKNTENFVLIDKTAIFSHLTGRGLGSLLYKALISDMKDSGCCDIFAETIISPKPNFASLEFRLKQSYNLAGVRYENYRDNMYTDLVYHKKI